MGSSPTFKVATLRHPTCCRPLCRLMASPSSLFNFCNCLLAVAKARPADYWF